MSVKSSLRAGALQRRLDFLLGVPLIFLLGLKRYCLNFRKKIPANPTTIGLIQLAAIGDTVIMSAIWRDLCITYPDAKILILVGESNYEISRILFGENNIILLPVKKPFQSFKSARKLNFDLLIDFGPWPRWNALLSALINAGLRIGYRTVGQYRHYAYDIAVDHSKIRHEIDNQRELVKVLGITPQCVPEISVLDKNSTYSGLDDKYVIFHPWAGGYLSHLREWPSMHWVELARRFFNEGFSIYISGAPSDLVKCEQLVDLMNKEKVTASTLAGKTSFENLITILKHSKAVVSVNTGIMHVSAATGALTIGLHGPTNSRRWGPIGPRAVSVSSPCSGCGFLNLGFEYPRKPAKCMEQLSVDIVWDQFLIAYKI